MRLKFYSLIVLVLIFSACSMQSKNIMKTDHYYLTSGIYKVNTWKDSLKFNRYTYYQDLSVKLDIMIAPYERLGNFKQWISNSDQEKITKCSQYYIVMIYDNQGDIFSSSNIFKELLANNTQIKSQTFIDNVKRHPTYRIDLLDQYYISGICLKEIKNELFELNLPGYSDLIITQKDME